MLAPAAWNVATTGAGCSTRAVIVGPGAYGSWRWMTSNCSSRSARIVRSDAAGSGANGAIEPFAAVGKLLPSGVTNVAGGGPSHGPSTRTSTPQARIVRARAITWFWTPPGIDRL